MKKKGKVAVKRKGVRKAKQAAKWTYNPQTGKLTGRAKGAQERLEKLAEKYVAEGMTLTDARNRAREEMRANSRKDWRAS